MVALVVDSSDDKVGARSIAKDAVPADQYNTASGDGGYKVA
jgi:hypothetical protein